VLSRNHFYRGKAISLTYSEWVFVVLFIQHTMPMHRIIIPPVACPAVPYFPILSRKFRNMCFDLLYILYLNRFSVQKIKRQIINVHGSSYKMTVILFRF